MNGGDDPQVRELTQVFLAFLRGEVPAPDLRRLDAGDRAKARELFALLDSLAGMGRELPLFEDDPVSKRLARRRPLVDHAPLPRPPQRTPLETGGRSRRPFRCNRPAWGLAAALTLVVLTATSLVILDSRTPAGAVQVGPLTSDCSTTFMGAQQAVARPGRRVVVAATWAGEERKRFEQVLGRFAEKSGIDVVFATHDTYVDRDIGETLERLEQQGCAPDVALLPQPGLMAELARNRHLTPLDAATTREVSRNYSGAWQELGKVDGVPYGVWFKAANKSIIWYNANAFARAGIDRPPSDWEGLKVTAAKLRAVGIAPFAVAGAPDDGWVLTDWLENVYLSTEGPLQYDRLATGALPWTDATVKGALARQAEIFTREEWLAGGTVGSLALTYEDSIRKVFGNRTAPEAAMVLGGDFVANLLATTESRIGVDARFFPFPSIGRYEPIVVGTAARPAPGEAGGDVAVLMTPIDAGRRLLRYLASPAAAEPWVSLGGFVSPNRRVHLGHYPDPVTRQAAKELVHAESLRFDLSDLLDPAFGSQPGHGMWKVLRDFLATPSDIDATAQRLEDEHRAVGR